jgi:hypothetical protein
MKARRALATTREPLRALHLASRGVLAAYGVPLGRPVSRRVFDRASGTVFWLPLRN